jgi:predicted amidohydrolase YtcJ
MYLEHECGGSRAAAVRLMRTEGRSDAIRLYTVADGWSLKEEDRLGSIEERKFGDVVVLSDDYFNEYQVPDVRKIHSVLTVVDGKVVIISWAADALPQ